VSFFASFFGFGRLFCVASEVIISYNTNIARKPRQESGTGVYRVMIRGINRQNIFEEKSDCERFLGVLSECKQIGGFKTGSILAPSKIEAPKAHFNC
jgi:hypothetical protein